MNTNYQNNWYDKTWLVIILCIFIFPIGLYALWRSSAYSKGWKLGGTIFVALLVLGAVNNKNDRTLQTSDTPNNKTKDNTEQPKATEKKADKKIPGLTPVDVYLNLEKQDFETDKNFSSDYGNSWDCKKSYAGIDYTVNIYSSDNVTTVERVRATAMLNGQASKTIIATKPFIEYISSIPYEGNEPNKVAEWLNKNFNNDKQSITISNVKFTIYAPTKMVRILDIEKEE